MNTGLIITICLLFLVVVLFLLASSPRKRVSASKKAELYQDFAKLYSSAVSDNPSVRRDAFIKMDNILSKALQAYYSNNETCGTNLKSAKKVFPKKEYEKIWEVHKLRNDIVHKDADVSKEESSKAFNVYKMSLVTLLK